jgi:hypothetical protein
MGEHLLQQTLTPEMAVMAEYYEQGVRAPTPADAVASRYSRLAVGGILQGDPVIDEVVKLEASRLADSEIASGWGTLNWDNLVMRSVAALRAAGLIDHQAAIASAQRLKAEFKAPEFETAIERARAGRDYTSATATPRRDMNPPLARRLGINPHLGLKPGEVAFLLNGQRVDGGAIEGRATQSASLPLAQIFGLDPDRRPTRAELANVLGGRKGNGEALPAQEAARAVGRFQAAMGAKDKVLAAEERENILSGRTASGQDMNDRQFRAVFETSKSRISYIDLTFSAPKSVSIAWAFAPTTAERAIIHQAHKDAIESVMLAIEKQIGRASKGRSARHGYEQGVIGWVSFDHYAARPTVEVIRTDESGQTVTELHRLTSTKGRVPGDMQVHTHVAVPNIVETPSGRVGSLDFAELDGRIHEWGALYQAYLASNLRTHGVKMELDHRTEMARVSAVPERVVAHFSRRTLKGTDAARAYARSQGLDWDKLDPERQIGLLKSGVQNRREGKADDVGDLEAWRRAAISVRYQHRSVLRPENPILLPDRTQRLEAAYQASMPLLARQFDRRAVIDGADARVAAARGLIAAGVETAQDVDAITRAFQERGIKRRGVNAALIWGTVLGTQGRDRVAITTTLEIDEEKALVASARAGARDKSSALSSKQIQTAVQSFGEIDFSGEHGRAQRKIIDQLGKGGRISVAIGVAGSGKSTLLKPLVRAWFDDGRAVHGIALAWRQSDDLVEAGIEPGNTRAVASFLKAAEAEKLGLNRKSVVVIDEVGLLGTRQLNDILAIQKKCGFQLVMLGDLKQMQSVEAGSVIELLRRALGADNVPELASSVRQHDAEERETVLMFRNGQTEEAVRRKDANGTLHIVPGGYQEAVAHVADLWEARCEANYDIPRYSISVSAPTNAQAHDISVAIRERRRNRGEISADAVTVRATDTEGLVSYDLSLAAGDRVRLFRRTNAKFAETNSVGNIGRNGSVLEVTEVRGDGLVLRNQSGREGFVAWSSMQDERTRKIQLAYGEALTTYTAQGTTVAEHIHAIPDGSRLVSAFAAYTSGSRHRTASYIVTSEGAERAEIVSRRPLGDRREVMLADILSNIVRNFSQQPIKDSALSMIDRAANLRKGTIQSVNITLQYFEDPISRGARTKTLKSRFAGKRINNILERWVPAIASTLQNRGRQIAKHLSLVATVVERATRTPFEPAVRRNKDTEYWKQTRKNGTVFESLSEQILNKKQTKKSKRTL